jgi:GxxExxY protein
VEASREAYVGSESELTGKILGAFLRVYNELGTGFVELVYGRALAINLREAGLKVECEVAVPVWYHGQLIGIYKADMVVEGKVILELKTANEIAKHHEAQLLNYLRATDIEIGLILNFGPTPKSRRMDFPNKDKQRQVSSAVIRS